MSDNDRAPEPRSEQVIFDDLARLCTSPGYVHAIAYFCQRDNLVRFSEELKADDMAHLYSKTRLIRTEISSLIGLMVKKEIDYGIPDSAVMQRYIDDTEALLAEMHASMGAQFWKPLRPGVIPDQEEFDRHLGSGSVLREPIFYGGESAYSFQYRDLAPRKYARDAEWLRVNKGFDMEAAREVAYRVVHLLNEKAMSTLVEMRSKPLEEWTFVPGYTFTAAEIAERTTVPIETINRVLEAFALTDAEKNERFNALHDFNVANAYPLLRVSDEKFLLLSEYSLVEAMYEAPFYWMLADSAYSDSAMAHRGQFTEEYSAERLARVVGEKRVFLNVVIHDSNGQRFGEIDNLVLFADRAIVLQAKSKRLTIESRKGNDGTLRDDFKKAIQDSCDQAYKCAGVLGDPSYSLRDRNGAEIRMGSPPKDVYVLCVVSDHYPALSFQSRQFLQYHSHGAVAPPYVLDVFTLDTVTEFLASPLRLLSYVDRRSKYADKLLASHELTVLAHHLKQNLWIEDETSILALDDSLGAEMDAAMMVRRDGAPGEATPPGILTRLSETTVGGFISEIERRPEPGVIALGYMLLSLAEDTVIGLSDGIDAVAKRSRADGIAHDITIVLKSGSSGLTVHCNDRPVDDAMASLGRHCHARKYLQRAQTWFGVCVQPSDTSLRCGVSLDFPWAKSEEMDAATARMSGLKGMSEFREAIAAIGRKVGRNDPCPCGSGKKYKKCCLPKRHS